jgi:hypothetical protein
MNDGYLVPVSQKADWDAWVLSWDSHYEGNPPPPSVSPVGQPVVNMLAWTFAFPKPNRY